MTVSTYPTALIERLTREKNEAYDEIGYREGGNSTAFDFKQLREQLDEVTAQRDQLKAQVERLLAKEARRIESQLRG